MSLLDGELSPSDASRVGGHLETCAECEGLVARYRSLRATFHSQELFPDLPRDGQKHPATVHQPEIASPSQVVPATKRLPSVLAASIALLTSSLLFWQLVLTPPGVSARELIERVRAEEQRPLLRVKNARVVRTLRTTRRVAGVVEQQIEHKETWQGTAGSLASIKEGNTLVREIVASIPSTDCARLDPLSAGMLACLSSESSAELRVLNHPKELEGGYYQVALDNLQPKQGNPFTSVWTLRLSDWRLTRVDFRFFQVPEDIEYGVEELDYRLINVPLITSAPEPAEVPTLPRTVASLQTESDTSRAVLNKADLFLTLHRLGLSPEDEIDIHFEIGKPIHVQVLVPAESRKQDFIEALAALDGVAASVASYADAMAFPHHQVGESQQQAIPSTARRPSAPPMRSHGPLLLDEVAAHFGGGEHGRKAALALGASVLDQTQTLQFQIHWLDRLRAAFSAEERRLLPAETLRQLSALETEWVEDTRVRHGLLQQQVQSVVCPDLCQKSQEVSASADLAWPSSEAMTPQRREGPAMLEAMKQEFTLLKVLLVDRGFTGDPTAHPPQGPPDLTRRKVQDWLEASARVADCLSSSPAGVPDPRWTSAR